MKVAVTGASGHVGANLCRELLRRGFEVKALIHNNDNGLKGLGIAPIHGSLEDSNSLNKLCEDVDFVFHLAAMISVDGKIRKLQGVNVDGTHNLLEVCKKSNIKRLIHFSSIHALSHYPLDESMDESRALVESSPMMYERTKAAGEKLVRLYARSGLDVVILNPTAILGPYDFKPSLMGQVLIRLYKGTLPALVPGGYNWVDVRDVANAAINALEKGRSGERYILSGTWTSVKDLAMTIEKVTGKKITQFMLPSGVAKLGVPFIQAYALITGRDPLYTFDSLEILKIGNRHILNGKAVKELDFQPRIFEDTIRDSIEWYKANAYL